MLDNSCRYPQMMDDWFINIACTRAGAATTTEPIRSRNVIIFSSGYEQHRPPRHGGAHSIRSILVSRALPGAYFICRHQGGSHAEWPKDSHEHAPTQTCGVIFCPPKAVDTECRPTQSNGHQNAQRSYERYLALAQEEARSGNVVGAENYYQHAEHYFRLMSSNREAT